MMLIDANLLLYAYDSSSQHHLRARNWLEKILSEPQSEEAKQTMALVDQAAAFKSSNQLPPSGNSF